VQGRFLPATRDGLLAIVARMRRSDAIEGLILAGTELPLILAEESYEGIPMFNTTRLHVQAAIARLVS
jgi:aspartate racemase